MRTWMWVAGLVCCSQMMHAQQAKGVQVSLSDSRAVVAEQGAKESHVQAVSMTFDDVNVLEAIQAIAERSGMQVIRQGNTAPFTDRVTRRIEARSIAEALRQVTEGTHASVAITPDGSTIAIRHRASDNVPARQGVIVGKILHAQSRQPVRAAVVAVKGGKQEAVSSETGTFRLAVPTGDQTLQVRALGFVRQTKNISVAAGATVTVEFYLEPSASVLDEVIVTGTVVETQRKEIPTPITVLTAADLERYNVTRLEQIFRGMVPGVVALERGSRVYGMDQVGRMVSAEVYARGSSGLDGGANPLKTYVDGVELVNSAYLGTIDVASIERIEIITGPQAATLYGSGAMGGVMQIFTKRGAGTVKPELTASLRYGMQESNLSSAMTPSHQHSLALAGGNGRDLNYQVTLSYNYLGKWQPGLFNESQGVTIGATHNVGRLTISGSFGVTRSENGVVQSEGQGSPYEQDKMRSGEWWWPYGSSILATPQTTSHASAQQASLNLDFRPASFWQSHFTLGRNLTRVSLEPHELQHAWLGDSLYQHKQQRGERVSVNFNSSFLPIRLGILSTTVTAGATGGWGDQANLQGCSNSPHNLALTPCYMVSATNLAIVTPLDKGTWGIFNQWRFGLWDRLYATVGLRGEFSDQYGRNVKVQVTPTNGLTYTLEFNDLSLKLMGSYGAATRQPTPSMRDHILSFSASYLPAERILQRASDNLGPEVERGPQGGIELYYGNLGSLTVSTYAQRVKDLIQRIIVDSVDLVRVSTGLPIRLPQYQYFNVAEIKKRGWESTFSLNIQAVSIRGAYAWNDSRVLRVNPTASAYYNPGRGFMDVPTHTGSLSLSYAHRGATIMLANNYIGRILTSETLPILDNGYARIRWYEPRVYPAGTGDRSRKGYVKSDFAFTQQLQSNVGFSLNVTNLGNSFGSEERIYHPALGRKFLFGVNMRLKRNNS